MAIRLEFIDGGDGLRLVTVGRVSGSDFIQVHRRLLETHADAFAAVRYWFADHRQLDATELPASAARQVAGVGHALARVNPALLVANLATEDVAFGMIRMWEAFADELGWASITTRDAAELARWLTERLGRAPALEGPADAPAVIDLP